MSDDARNEPIEVDSAIDEAEHRQALAAALLGKSLTPGEAERARLHALLDQVLDYRAQYESLPRGLNALRELMLGKLPNPEEARLSQAAFTAAVELLVRSLGGIRSVMLPPLGMDPANARLTLQFWLLRLGTMLRQPGMFGGPPSITLDQVIEELEDLGFGCVFR